MSRKTTQPEFASPPPVDTPQSKPRPRRETAYGRLKDGMTYGIEQKLIPKLESLDIGQDVLVMTEEGSGHIYALRITGQVMGVKGRTRYIDAHLMGRDCKIDLNTSGNKLRIYDTDGRFARETGPMINIVPYTEDMLEQMHAEREAASEALKANKAPESGVHWTRMNVGDLIRKVIGS